MKDEQLEEVLVVMKQIADGLGVLNRTLEKTLTMVAVATPWAGR